MRAQAHMQLDVDAKVQLLTGVLHSPEAAAKIIKRAPYVLGFSEETLKVPLCFPLSRNACTATCVQARLPSCRIVCSSLPTARWGFPIAIAVCLRSNACARAGQDPPARARAAAEPARAAGAARARAQPALARPRLPRAHPRRPRRHCPRRRRRAQRPPPLSRGAAAAPSCGVAALAACLRAQLCLLATKSSLSIVVVRCAVKHHHRLPPDSVLTVLSAARPCD